MEIIVEQHYPQLSGTAASGKNVGTICCSFGLSGANTMGYDCAVIPGAETSGNSAIAVRCRQLAQKILFQLSRVKFKFYIFSPQLSVLRPLPGAGDGNDGHGAKDGLL